MNDLNKVRWVLVRNIIPDWERAICPDDDEWSDDAAKVVRALMDANTIDNMAEAMKDLSWDLASFVAVVGGEFSLDDNEAMGGFDDESPTHRKLKEMGMTAFDGWNT